MRRLAFECFAFVALVTLGIEAPAQDRRFVEAAEQRLLELWADSERAGWVARVFVTEDTEIIAAKAEALALQATADYAKRAAGFPTVGLDAATARKLTL